MNKLRLIKSERFGSVEADIYSNGSDMFMTAAQLCECLGESRGTFDSRLSRNPYLKSNEFSVSCKLQGTDGKQYNTRTFNEDGIYEITMLAETPKAKEFRRWIRRILKCLRKGNLKIVSMTDYQRMSMETRQENIRIRKANALLRIANEVDIPTYKQVLYSNATEILTGQALIPLPATKKSYTATEIGDMFGVSSNYIGRLANANGLKIDDYGEYVYDKAKSCEKQVPSFRYFDSAIPVFRKLIK